MDTIQLEKDIRHLFNKEGIGECADRFLGNMRHINPDDEDYKKSLILRLRQGEVEGY